MSGRTEAQRARKMQRELEKMTARKDQTFQPPPGPPIMELVLADLDKLMARYLDLKIDRELEVELARVRGEIRGMARVVGRFGWSGVTSYRPIAGMKEAERQSLARVRKARDEA